MSLSETDDPVKGRLLKRQHEHEDTMQEEVKSISDQAQKVINTALIAGGVLTLAYILYLELGGKKKKKSKKQKGEAANEPAEDEHHDKEPGVLAHVGTAVANQALLFLLDIARTKLAEYVESQKAKVEAHDRS